MIINLNNRPYEYAKTLNDGKLLARLSAGDASAQELKYVLLGFHKYMGLVLSET